MKKHSYTTLSSTTFKSNAWWGTWSHGVFIFSTDCVQLRTQWSTLSPSETGHFWTNKDRNDRHVGSGQITTRDHSRRVAWEEGTNTFKTGRSGECVWEQCRCLISRVTDGQMQQSLWQMTLLVHWHSCKQERTISVNIYWRITSSQLISTIRLQSCKKIVSIYCFKGQVADFMITLWQSWRSQSALRGSATRPRPEKTRLQNTTESKTVPQK